MHFLCCFGNLNSAIYTGQPEHTCTRRLLESARFECFKIVSQPLSRCSHCGQYAFRSSATFPRRALDRLCVCVQLGRWCGVIRLRTSSRFHDRPEVRFGHLFRTKRSPHILADQTEAALSHRSRKRILKVNPETQKYKANGFRFSQLTASHSKQ